MKTSAPRIRAIRSLRYRCSHYFTCAAVLLAQFTLLPGSAQADITAIGQEIGGNVVINFSGSVNTAGFSGPSPSMGGLSFLDPANGIFQSIGSGSLDIYEKILPPFSFGSGSFHIPSVVTGNNFGLNFAKDELFVNLGYISGTPLSGSMKFNGTTFSALGITKGTYSIQITPGFMFTLIFGAPPPPHYEQTSAQTTGLPMANAEGQMVIGTTGTVTNDVNGFLFTLRAGDGEEAANDDNSGVGANLDYGVVVGQGDGPEDAKNPIAKKVLKSRQWELFTTVGYGNVKLKPISSQSGVQVDSWAPSVGISRHLSRGLAVGFATTFLTSDQRYTGNLGNLHMEGPALSTYVSYVRKDFWNSLLYSFGDYTLDSNRNPGFGFPQAHGSTRSYTHSVQYNTGWSFRFQNNTLVTGPFAGIDYLHGTVNAYTESGGGLAALAYGKQTFQSLVTRVGWTASKKIQTDWAMVTPQVRLSYERQNLQNNGTSVNLINAPFSARGGNQSPGQSYMVAGGGVNFDFTDQLSLQLNYQVQVFRQDMQAHYGQVRIGYKF